MKNVLLFFAVVLIACNSNPSRQVSDSLQNDSLEITPKESLEKNIFCNELAEEILKSSPRYKKLTEGLLEAVRKNGGTSVSIVMEKSPDSPKESVSEFSANYEMQLTENYPDRQISIARFVFNPEIKALYEYDIIADSLKTITYETKLLDDPQQFCK